MRGATVTPPCALPITQGGGRVLGDICGTEANRSVQPPGRVRALDRLLAVLAPRNGEVQSPGSVEDVSAWLEAPKDAVLAVQDGRGVTFLIEPSLLPKVPVAVRRTSFVAPGSVDGVTRESSASVDGFSHRVHAMSADLHRERLSGAS